MAHRPDAGSPAVTDPDPREPLPRVLRELGTDAEGLSEREAARLLAVYGTNEVEAGEQSSIGRELVRNRCTLFEESNQVAADARLTEGGTEVDLSLLTGESAPAERVAGSALRGAPLLREPDLVFSGTTCTGRQASGIVFATSSGTVLAASPHDNAELVFTRSSPETELKVADALRQHQIVAMTGDGVDDAPALHRAHIGAVMGRSGTDVAREAATVVLTDGNFATIVTAIEVAAACTTTYASSASTFSPTWSQNWCRSRCSPLSGGAVLLPLTVLQVLATDLGTETLPALAFGRERAEPGIMSRLPRKGTQGVFLSEHVDSQLGLQLRRSSRRRL